MKQKGTWPRVATLMHDPDETCKATRRGAAHWVNPPGCGGASRKMNRRNPDSNFDGSAAFGPQRGHIHPRHLRPVEVKS